MLQCVPPARGSTFFQYVVKFTDGLSKKLNYVERVDVVWDVRQDTSVKLVRSTRGTGTSTILGPLAKRPNWQKFLRVGDKLSELQDLISNHIHEYKKGKIMVTTHADSVVSNVF